MSFQSILSDIMSLRIQGAEHVALASLDAISLLLEKPDATLFKKLKKAQQDLIATRPTEPMLRNALAFVLQPLHHSTSSHLAPRHLASVIQKRIAVLQQSFEMSRKKIIEIGVQKIKQGMVIATHCHASTVTAILIEAKRQGKKFTVLNTETRPLYQGRITATELSTAGIPVTLYVDSAAEQVVKKADLYFLGADAISVEGSVYNKVGSGLIAQLAHQHDVPLYICAHAWKLDPQTLFGIDVSVEERSADEVWKERPKGVKIANPAFDRISSEYITGIITELGIFSPEQLIEEVEKKYPELFMQ